MRVQRVQNDNTNFSGRFLKNVHFRQLEQHLYGTQKESFEKIIRDIEETKDNHVWAFSVEKMGAVRVARLSRIDEKGVPCSADFATEYKSDSSSLELFERLRRWYKYAVKEFKEY